MNRQHECLERMHREITRQVELSDEEWQAMLPYLTMKTVGAKQCLQEAGEPVSYYHFVIDGLVRLYYLTSDGKELNKAFYGENYVVGNLSAAILNEPSRFVVETLEPCTLVELPWESIQSVIHDYPGCERWFNHCCQMMLIRNERREAELLTMSAKERFLQFITNFPGYVDRIPQYHIASYLGITPVALSRYKKQWLSTHD